MNQEQIKAARAKGRFIGGMSGLIFVLTLGLLLWTRLGWWYEAKWAFTLFIGADLSLILVSAWMGGWMARRLLPPAEERIATQFGTLGGVILDLLFCFFLAALNAPELIWPFTWDKAMSILNATIQGAGCGLLLAVGWGAGTALVIRGSLQTKMRSPDLESQS